jgi:hypothetical protein
MHRLRSYIYINFSKSRFHAPYLPEYKQHLQKECSLETNIYIYIVYILCIYIIIYTYILDMTGKWCQIILYCILYWTIVCILGLKTL